MADAIMMNEPNKSESLSSIASITRAWRKESAHTRNWPGMGFIKISTSSASVPPTFLLPSARTNAYINLFMDLGVLD
jgi:hypothetical protein